MDYTIRGTEVGDKTYRGFNLLKRQRQLQPEYQVVIAWVEDCPELWVIESRMGFEQLQLMYAEVFEEDCVSYTILDLAA